MRKMGWGDRFESHRPEIPVPAPSLTNHNTLATSVLPPRGGMTGVAVLSLSSSMRTGDSDYKAQLNAGCIVRAQ